MNTDPALRFLVELVEREGGAAEDRGESVLLLVDDGLRDHLGLPEELTVTDDPEVAAEEGSLLAVPGQPVVSDAAEMVLRRGDAGWCRLDRPAAPPPTRDRLQEAAREQFDVDHGRIDVEGQPTSCWVPVLHAVALLEVSVSVEERYEERAEVFVDARDGTTLPPRVTAALAGLVCQPGRGSGYVRAQPDLRRAVESAHASLDARAAERQAALVRDARSALERERERVDAYYEATLASIGARREGAAIDRARLYDAQEEATRAEWARRREETEGKFAGSREVLPFRLHLVDVPALHVPATIRRGARTFGLRLDWLLPFSCFLGCRCPHCGADEPLVAGRDRLGCRACLSRIVALPPARPATARQAGTADAASPERNRGPGIPKGRADRPHADADRPHADADRSHADADRSPGRTQRDKRIEKVWRDVARGFWGAVGSLERYGSVTPRSPLDALYRCYGPAGPLLAVGLAPDAFLRGMHAFLLGGGEDGTDVLSTAGTVHTSDGLARFVLRWRLVGRDPSVIEVLPPGPPAGGRSLPTVHRSRNLLGGVPGPETPRPRDLGPVETLVWQDAIGDGLPLVVRSLALYWRVQGQRRLGPVRPNALAAAVVATARRHSELRGGADWAARRHGVPAAEVRDACDVLASVLGAAAEHLW